MMVLKTWAQNSDSKVTKWLRGRESGIMRFARLRMKTMRWKMKTLKMTRFETCVKHRHAEFNFDVGKVPSYTST